MGGCPKIIDFLRTLSLTGHQHLLHMLSCWNGSQNVELAPLAVCLKHKTRNLTASLPCAGR